MGKTAEEGELDMIPDAVQRQVADLARRARKVNGPMMRALNSFGGKAEAWMAALPLPARQAFDNFARQTLVGLYHGAGQAKKSLPDLGSGGHKWAAALSGAAGGSAGMASAMVELPATVMLMFGAMQRAASDAGYDPDAEDIRLACIDIFGSGGPGTDDDGINTTFLGARLSLNRATLQAVIGRIAPAFSLMLGKQLAGKAVPVVGALAGAGLNFAFTDYYQDVARVRFGLMRLAEEHGRARIHHAFRAEMARNLPL